jgi:ribosomal protein S18 acetylase RimI-like enzyme
MSDLTIRPALPADEVALAALDPIAASDLQRLADIRRWLAQGWVEIAVLNGTLAGYSVLHDHFFGRRFLELAMVGVGFRNKGVGSALITHALSKSHAAELWTSTNQSNLAMQRLLTRLGFVQSGTIENLDAGDPELIFRAVVQTQN